MSVFSSLNSTIESIRQFSFYPNMLSNVTMVHVTCRLYMHTVRLIVDYFDSASLIFSIYDKWLEIIRFIFH